ncbi:MAG: hypothetical protein JXB62_00080 [Pirellulales bacterium]|nr:hypothetical protein [Pirellulales bacterium]
MKLLRIVGVLTLLALVCLLPWVGRPAMEPTATCLAQGAAVATPGTPVSGRAAIGISLGSGFAGPGRSLEQILDGSVELGSLSVGELQSCDRELEAATHRAAQEYAHAEDNEQPTPELKEKLTKTIAAHFDVRHEIRDREVRELEAQVRKLRQLVARRADARKDIIDMRVQQFVSAAEGLGWNDEGPLGQGAGWMLMGGSALFLAPASTAVDATNRPPTNSLPTSTTLQPSQSAPVPSVR